MKIYVADIEANGLLEEEKGKSKADRIWCLSFCNVENGIVKTITDYNIIRKFFEQEDCYIVMHNGVNYDIPLLESLLKFKVKSKIIDSLGLSWTISVERNLHGLESWGETVGVKKPSIIEWNDEKLLPEYINRCEQDVLINLKVWQFQYNYLEQLYDKKEDLFRYVEYISFKLECVKKQKELGVKLDLPLIKEALMNLENLKVDKIENLKVVMPKVPVKAIKDVPKVMYKANGDLSANGIKWQEFLTEQGLPNTWSRPIEFIKGYEEPNPNSHAQIKNWLFSLDWSPEYFKYVKEEGKSEMRKIPQISSKDEPGEVCNSVKKLFSKEPNLEELNGLGIISHRISVLKGFLRDQKDGRLYQGISGLTNTLRLMHTGIVNLPNYKKPFSENIRASLIADEGKILVGSDLSGIEDATKRHYIYDYDPEYVESMNTPGFDPHLEIAVLAGFLTQEQADNHKNGTENHNEIRQKSKVVNFSATYKVGKQTLSRNSGLSLKESEKILAIYWERNKAILEVENALEIKQVNRQQWLLNPISKFWYTLRSEKDKFSTLNQSKLCSE